MSSPLGSILSNKSIPEVRAGSETFVAATTATITFSSPMPSTDYYVALTHEDGLLIHLSAQNKTTDGFDIVCAGPITGTVAYLAVTDA